MVMQFGDKMVMQFNEELLAALYDGCCTVYVTEPSVGESGWHENGEERILYRDIPCHLAFEQTAAASHDLVSEVKAGCVLFCGAEYEILPASRVVVEQNGREYDLSLTGLPRVYAVHQEIRATLLDRLA